MLILKGLRCTKIVQIAAFGQVLIQVWFKGCRQRP